MMSGKTDRTSRGLLINAGTECNEASLEPKHTPDIDSSQSGFSDGVASITRLSDAARAYGDNSTTDYAGDTSVPDSVRDVISSSGQSLDPDVQRTMESEMGDSFSDVQVHTGPKAVQACDDINARAFTVGNNIAFNHGEYDPGSPEGQHVLAHVRQQTGGAVSMLPQDDLDLEIDPDPELEQEAEETAQRVMQGGELGIHRMEDADVHVQRLSRDEALPAYALFSLENDSESSREPAGDFQRSQNQERIGFLRESLVDAGAELYPEAEQQHKHMAEQFFTATMEGEGSEVHDDGTMTGVTNSEDGGLNMTNRERYEEIMGTEPPDESEVKRNLEKGRKKLASDAEQVGLTENQRDEIKGGIDFGKVGDFSLPLVNTLLSTGLGALSGEPHMGAMVALSSGIGVNLAQRWNRLDGDIVDRIVTLREDILNEAAEQAQTSEDDKPESVPEKEGE